MNPRRAPLRPGLSAAALCAALALAGCAQQTVSFPPEPTPGSLFHSLYKPEGAGPFPAVVLLHTCAGVQPHVFDWAHRLTEWGYVTLVVDSFTPRGERIVCGSWRVSVNDVAADAFAALARLRTLPFVDRDRVAVMGFSYGAMATLRLASEGYRKWTHADVRGFRAAVALYPYCTPPSPNLPPDVVERLDNLRDDTTTPLLILIGGADDESPAALCSTRVGQLQRRGEPVAIKVYPGVTHAFDYASLGDRPFTTPRGFTYRYNREATEDAAQVSRAFLDRHLHLRE